MIEYSILWLIVGGLVILKHKGAPGQVTDLWLLVTSVMGILAFESLRRN